ncbi:hypothetical protein [Vibrio bivalvicida]|uniref:Uncharacterized protein n=4 Tax=Vibrionaceae TaxID=641 RepID=A0A0H3ZYX7_VIBSP|nr:hypothetical protein [Enterovibrio norvegicus]AKN37788.1 hypothetical protein [Vibrio sp. FF_482]AKN39827.1 hypothetical protein [Vibrio splendidus]
MELQPNKQTPISVGGKGKYLIVRSTSAPVFIGDDNLRPQRLESGDRINVSEFDKLFLEHKESQTVTFDYQISDLEVRPASTSGLVVQRIIEPIEFSATVSVADGLKVEPLSPAAMTTKPDIEIAPNAKVKICNSGFRKVSIQVISDEVTTLRVGDFNIASNRGLMVMGSKHATGSLSLEFTGELYAVNTSTSTARLSVVGVN